jgi:hypothetical protein
VAILCVKNGGFMGKTTPTQRDALTQQMFHHGAPLNRNAAVFGRGTELAFARLTLMMLFPMAGMAIFLYRLDPHAGHTSLRSMAAVGLPSFGSVFDQQKHGTEARALPV